MKVLLIRFDAPLMSFGAPIIDRYGVIQPYPALSQICGMLGNALGYDHSEPELLQRLQERIRYASRQDRRGRQIRDYQTVDLGSDFMNDDLAWTSRGELEKRTGGTASSGTHIRLRDYWADGAHTVAITLEKASESPTLEELAQALQFPERPLFIGRKTCLPAEALYRDLVETIDLVGALQQAPLADMPDNAPYPVWYSAPSPNRDEKGVEYRPVTDGRDWKNQIHVGQRWLASTEILVTAKEASNG